MTKPAGVVPAEDRPQGPSGASADDPASLRILATSDIHMHLLPFDYYSLCRSQQGSLARLGTLIRRRQAEVPTSVLLDNGDFLQGNPMGDLAAADAPEGPRKAHPAIAAMNALGYDAAALGNHDFNFGLSCLRRAAAAAAFPLLAANLSVRHVAPFTPYTILERELVLAAGGSRLLRIGIVGFLPPQTAEWDQDLTGQLQCEDIIDCARRVLPLIKAEGADLIIALAHSGIGPAAAQPRMEHAATALAALPQVDVVIAGHTHQVFPHPEFPAAPGVDPSRGTLAGKPAAMPGFGGSHLAVIDLALEVTADVAPRITGFTVTCEAVTDDLQELPEVAQPLRAAHVDTLRHMQRRAGRCSGPISSHFSLLGRDPGLRLVAQAQRWHVRRKLQGTRWQDLPILSSAAPFRAGGRAGPDHYTQIDAGSLRLRHLADLYAFPNRIAAVCLCGNQIREWLERSASIFRQIAPGSADAPLLDPDFPSYNFDIIDGVSWRIDLSSPARYMPCGDLADPDATRIRELTWRGRPISAEDRFILATNSYRLASCGLFAPLVAGNEVPLAEGPLTRDMLRGYVRRRRRIAPDERLAWRFMPQPGTTALFPTTPQALAALPSTDLQLEPAGSTDDGFALLRLSL